MANLNKVYLIGRLTADPDNYRSPRGTQIVTLHLAINRDIKDEHGNKQKETCFIDVLCLGKLGELAAQYLSKGRECMIEGRLRMQTWTDKATGKQRSKLDVLADNLQFLGGGTPTQNGQQSGDGWKHQNMHNAAPSDNDWCSTEADDDIAF